MICVLYLSAVYLSEKKGGEKKQKKFEKTC